MSDENDLSVPKVDENQIEGSGLSNDALSDRGITPEILEGRIARTFTKSVALSRSPYPSPEMLSAYAEFRPDFPNHIIAKIDEETEHR